MIDNAINERKPLIRFKGFTEAWEQRKLGEIGKTFTGLSGKSKDDFGHGQARFITYMNIFKNPIAKLEETEPIEIDEKQSKVQYGDIFFTTSSETPDEVGMSSIWLENAKNTYFNSFCFGYRLNNLKSINPYYLAYLLRANSFRSNMILLAQGISRYNISKTKAMEINIDLPSLKDEQEKIGTLFSNLDNLITLHQCKCDKLDNIKRSLLQKMFPAEGEFEPVFRFKGFTEAWEQRKFGEIAILRRGLTYSPKDISDVGIRVLRSMNIDESSFKTFEDDVFVRRDSIKIEMVKNGDILITSANGSPRLVGKHAIIHGMQEDSAVHGGFMLIASTKEYNFLNASMSSQWYLNFLKMHVAGGNGAIGNLNAKELNEYRFYIPSQNEQTKIGVLFQNLDNLITLHHRKVELLKNIKKSLLQKMFC